MSAATMNEMDRLRRELDEVKAERDALAAQLDRAEEELAEAKRAQAIMRDAFDTQVQQAVSRARRDWAAQGSPWVKARWQAEALETVASISDAEGEPWDAERLRHHAGVMRHQAEESTRGHH